MYKSFIDIYTSVISIIRYVHDRSLHLIEENFIKLFSNNNEKNLICLKRKIKYITLF